MCPERHVPLCLGPLTCVPRTQSYLRCLCDDRAEPQDGKAKEQGPDDGYGEKLRPHHVEPGAAIENRLREGDEMGRWRYLHECGEPGRHALKRSIAAREHV